MNVKNHSYKCKNIELNFEHVIYTCIYLEYRQFFTYRIYTPSCRNFVEVQKSSRSVTQEYWPILEDIR